VADSPLLDLLDVVKPKSVKKAFGSDSKDDEASVKVDNSVNQSLEDSIQGLSIRLIKKKLQIFR
jgi:hypothetical protein